jgi:hypothetical protein
VPKNITRNDIIQVLKETLEPLNYIHALWEGGAAAFSRIDEWSDLDIYLVVDRPQVKEAFDAVENALKSLTRIKQKYDVGQTPWTGIYQAFYRLEGTSKYLIIDLAVLTTEAPDKLLEPEIHGKAVFYFNKSGIEVPRLDQRTLVEKIQLKLEKLNAKREMFNNFVQKEINRGNYIEAIHLYHHLTLDLLIDALRIRYNLPHFDFKTRYIHYELPLKVIERLKHLCFVQDESELQGKYRKATEWFNELLAEISREKIGENQREPST